LKEKRERKEEEEVQGQTQEEKPPSIENQVFVGIPQQECVPEQVCFSAARQTRLFPDVRERTRLLPSQVSFAETFTTTKIGGSGGSKCPDRGCNEIPFNVFNLSESCRKRVREFFLFFSFSGVWLFFFFTSFFLLRLRVSPSVVK
jgi:hypothetical protein